MKNILIAIAFAAAPVFAQEAPQCPQFGNKPCAPKCERPHGPRCHQKGDMHKKMLEKFDANKDGQLDDQEKAAMKAEFEAMKAEMEKKLLEKFDANKDGQLDDQAKAAIQAEFEAKRGERQPGCGKGPKGPRHHKGHGHGPKGPRHMGPQGPKGDMHKKMMEKFDANKDGQLDDQEKAAMKAEFEARKAEMEKKLLEKFDANKDGQLDDQEKAAIKAEFEAKRGERGPKGPRPCKGCDCKKD